MIEKPEQLRALTHELGTATWTLAALATLLESGVVDHLREPRTAEELAQTCPGLAAARIERCLDVAATVGIAVADGPKYRLAEGVLPLMGQPARASLEGELRTALMQALALVDSAKGDRPIAGWCHTDPAILQAQGNASGGFPPMFKAMIVQQLGELGARLERKGARFLDVGVGVAALSISMCRAYPEIHAVGLDVFDVPLAMARKNVANAGLENRIELRKLPAQDLADQEAFDLAWVPSFFLPGPVLKQALSRVFAALRPGGWILLGIGPQSTDDRQRAVTALLVDVWGGPNPTVATAEAILKEIGFSSCRTVAGPGWAPVLLVAQR